MVMTTCWIDPCKLRQDDLSILGWQLFTGKAWEIAVGCIVVVLYALVKTNIATHVRTPISIVFFYFYNYFELSLMISFQDNRNGLKALKSSKGTQAKLVMKRL